MEQYNSKPSNKVAHLGDRLYIKEEFVTDEHLDAFQSKMLVGKDPELNTPIYDVFYHYEKIQITRDETLYAFSRGNLELIYQTFKDFEIIDQRVFEPMRAPLKIQFRNGKTWREYQPAAVEALLDKEYGVLKAPPRAGKPVWVENLITMGDGSLKPLKEIQKGDLVITHKGRPRKVLEVFEQPQLDCLEMQTFSRVKTVAALDHPYLTPEGFIEAGKLKLGQSLVHRTFDVPDSPRRDEEFLLAGFFIGDGSTLYNHAKIHTKDEIRIKEIQRCCEALGFTSTLYLQNSRVPCINISNGVRDWLRASGLAEKEAWDKHVPAWVFKASNRQISLFLSAYFACEGTVSTRGKTKSGETRSDAYLELYSVSLQLLKDCQNLLDRLGVRTSIRSKKGKYKKNEHYSWRLSFYSQDDVVKFRDLSFECGYKIVQLKKLKGFKTYFPQPFWTDEIIDIKQIEKRDCRCLTVEGDHTFIADGFVVHNTVMLTAAICTERQKTLVFAHQTDLLEQMLDTFEEFTNLKELQKLRKEPIVGFAKTWEDFEKLDVVLCTKQTFDHINNRHHLIRIQKMFGYVLTDECFPCETKILTEQGSKRISTLFNWWAQKKPLPRVLSFNQLTKKFEYKNITYAWKKEPKSQLVKIKTEKHSFQCTLEHKLLTSEGWQEAGKLIPGDSLVGKYAECSSISPILNEDQKQILWGSYLGDGYFSKAHSKFRLAIIHGSNQEAYLKWKAFMFNVEDQITRIEKNGFSQKPAFKFVTKSLNINIPTGKKKKIPQDLINQVDERALAIWYMDDGSYNSNRVTFHTNRFDEKTQFQLIKMLEKFGINKVSLHYTTKKDGRKFPYICINTENSFIFLKKISPYIHPACQYKTPFKCGTYRWEKNFSEMGYCSVKSVEIIQFQEPTNRYQRWLYDLEIEDNHNFIVSGGGISGIVAHNCHLLPAQIYSKTVNRFWAARRQGCTATPKRKDGLDVILDYVMGPVIHEIKPEQTKRVPVNVLTIGTGVTYRTGNWARYISYLSTLEARNALIVKWIVKDVLSGHTVIAVTDRKPHCYELQKMLEEHKIRTVVFNGDFTSRTKRREVLDLMRSGEAKVMIAMRNMTTGLDIPRADCFYNLLPSANAVAEGAHAGEGGYEQQCTRVLTEFPGKQQAHIRDFIDSAPIAYACLKQRQKTYVKIGASLEKGKTTEEFKPTVNYGTSDTAKF